VRGGRELEVCHVAGVERYAYELSGISSNKVTIKVGRAGTFHKPETARE